MSTGKTLILVNYLTLLGWWIVLSSVESTSGLGNSFFNLGMGLYAFVFGLSLATSSYRHEDYIPHRQAVSVGSMGMAMFGLGTILWFYYDYTFGVEVPFPSMSDFFYVIQFPFSVMGIISLSYRDLTFLIRPKKIETILGIVIKGVLFVLLTCGVVWVLSYLYSGELFNIETFLLFYFPIESCSVLLLAFIAYVKLSRSWQQTVSRWYSLVVFGYATWVVGDLTFSYQISTETYYNASYADMLFCTGACLILLGLIGVVEGSKVDGFISPYSPIFFTRSVSFYPSHMHSKIRALFSKKLKI